MRQLVFLLAAVLITATSYSAKLSGVVYDKQNGNTISKAKVLLVKALGTTNTAITDANGNFEFVSLNEGDYFLRIEKSGYEVYEQKISLTGDKEIKVELILKAKPIEDNVVVQDKEEVEKTALFNTKRSYSAEPVGAGMGYTGNSYDYVATDWNTESYDFIDENNFKNTLVDPLSTFSIDVDRAAYANVRRFLNQNTMPYPDAVRIEEMINYFDYDYPQPSGEHPFSTSLELGVCPWNKDHKLLLIGIQGEKMESENIPPANLVFLIDVSGSMNSSNKLPLLKQSFKILVDQLRPEDRVAIVVYAGAAGCVLESTPGSEKAKILAALDLLEAGGSTAGGAGIKLAYKIAKENYVRNGNNRVILATDGDFNVGESSDAAMERLIEEKRDDGVFLTILGFGMGNYKDSKMEKLSNKGNGNYAYIDNILEAKKMFVEELWGTLYTIAKDVKIQIEFNPAYVKGYRLVGYENRLLNKEDFNDDTKDAGEIGSGHSVTALYELIPADSDETVGDVDDLNYQKVNIKRSNDLMTLKIRYKKPDEDISKLIESKISVAAFGETSGNFKIAASIAQFGMLLRDSEFKGEASYESTLALAKSAKGKDEFGYRNEYITLVEKASLLSK
jgi:Ca-activated chloride channel homolog